MTDNVPINILELPVHYINLKQDTEKRKKMEKMLAELGFTDVHRFKASYSDTKSLGCAMSHNSLLHQMKGEKTPFIVLEDDVKPNIFRHMINVPKGADAYYLGNSMWGIYNGRGHKKISLNQYNYETYRIYNMLTAHAIMYNNPEYVSFLAQATDFNVAIKTNQDKARAETMKYWNVYASKVPLFYQDGRYKNYTKFTLPGPTGHGPSEAYTF
jgi:hypothetical protein